MLRYRPKDFRQRAPDGAGWTWSVKGIRRVPYNLAAVLEGGDRTVYIVEGENDADALINLGLIATTNPGGAGKWRDEFAQFFAGTDIVILPDNDEAGHTHAEAIARSLAPVAQAVRVVALPGLPPKGDASDWLAAGGTLEALDALVRAAPVWQDTAADEDPFAGLDGPPQDQGQDQDQAGQEQAQAHGEWRALNLPELASCEPQVPRFIVADWLPVGYAALLAGHGGAGKSYIALALAVSIAAGVPWCGIPVERRRVLLVECEDRKPILHWRLARICTHLGIDLAALDGWLFVYELVGCDTILWRPDPNGRSPLTPAYTALAAQMHKTQADLIMIDGTADTFGGSENDRAQVKAYINALLALVSADNGAVLLIGHVNKPSAANPATSEGYSGSTSWHNAVRARWYLRPETRLDDDEDRSQRTGELILELQKSNLGRTDQEIPFRWDPDDHLFIGQRLEPEVGMLATIRDQAERNAILEAMADCAARNIYVPAAATGRRTAHHVLQATGKLPDKLSGKASSRRRFWRRIEELRQTGILREGSIRRANRHQAATLEITPGRNEGVRQCVE